MATKKSQIAPSGEQPAGAPQAEQVDHLAAKWDSIRNMTNNKVELSPGEKVLRTWAYKVVTFNPKDKMFSLMTLGIYSFIMKNYRKQKQHVALILTDRRLIIKEEVYNKVPMTAEEMWEGQHSLSIKDLCYVRMETGLGGFLEPDYFVMDFHFITYPSELEPDLYVSWGAQFVRPIADTFAVALDNSTGGLFTQIKMIRKNPDPLALLAAISDAQQAAAEVVANPLAFMLMVMGEFFKEAFRRMATWFKLQLNLIRDIIVGLVPIANLPRKFITLEEGGEHPNMVRLRIYRDDDNQFVENGQAFLKAVSDARDKLVAPWADMNMQTSDSTHPFKCSAAPFAEVKDIAPKGAAEMNIPSFMFGFMENSRVMSLAPIKPRIGTMDKFKSWLTCSLYYFSDLQGKMQHTGAIVLTDRHLILSSLKVKHQGKKGVDHARIDCWWMGTPEMHAIDNKWDFFKDPKSVIIIGIRDLGTIFIEVTDMDLPKLHPIQRLLSMGLPQTLQLKVDKTHYLNPADKEVTEHLTTDMLLEGEQVLSLWQAKDVVPGFVAKLMSLGLAEETTTVFSFTQTRFIMRQMGTNCRGLRKCWEVSIPLQHIRGVYWSNFYHKTNGKAKVFMKIPIVGKCIGLAMMMRGLQDDKTDHWWLGRPGSQLHIIAGRQSNFGFSITGKMMWFTEEEDCIRKTIINSLAMQLANGDKNAPSIEGGGGNNTPKAAIKGAKPNGAQAAGKPKNASLEAPAPQFIVPIDYGHKAQFHFPLLDDALPQSSAV